MKAVIKMQEKESVGAPGQKSWEKGDREYT